MFSADELDKYPILTPTGTVIDATESVYDSVEEWMTRKNNGGY
jgi:hypothetical protein